MFGIKLFKRVTYDSTIPMLTNKEVTLILKTQLGNRLAKNPIIMLSDENYTTITPAKVGEIYSKSELVKFKYRDDVSDCDDAALLFKSAMVKQAMGDWSVLHPYATGIVYGYIPTPHAINWFITPSKSLLFIEPQSGEIFAPRGKNIFFLYS